MTNQVLDMNEALVAKILYDFDGQLQARFHPACSSLSLPQTRFQKVCFMKPFARSGMMPDRWACVHTSSANWPCWKTVSRGPIKS